MLGTHDFEDAASQAAGNWNSFVWFREDVDDTDNGTIIYSHNRDYRLLDLSNAGVIAKAMEPFIEGHDPDVVAESHDHWAAGHVDGFSIRVFKEDKWCREPIPLTVSCRCGSLAERRILSPWPVRRSPNWLEHVNEPQADTELAALRRNVV